MRTILILIISLTLGTTSIAESLASEAELVADNNIKMFAQAMTRNTFFEFKAKEVSGDYSCYGSYRRLWEERSFKTMLTLSKDEWGSLRRFFSDRASQLVSKGPEPGLAEGTWCVVFLKVGVEGKPLYRKFQVPLGDDNERIATELFYGKNSLMSQIRQRLEVQSEGGHSRGERSFKGQTLRCFWSLETRPDPNGNHSFSLNWEFRHLLQIFTQELPGRGGRQL